MSTIGERISRVIREKCGKKVTFARDLKIDQSYVTQLENGRRNPSKRLIDNICQTYGVNREWLLNGNGEPYARKSRDEEIEAAIKSALSGEPDSFKARLIFALSRLDVNDWAALEKLFNSIYAPSRPVSPQSRNVHEWTKEELLAEAQRQIEAEAADREKGTGESSTGSLNVSGADCA